MNEIIRNLTIEHFANLKASFDNSKRIFWDEGKDRLVHPGEYGTYREALLKRWLRIYIPPKFGISAGFLINSENKISGQCDIIIYDRDNTPQIESSEDQRFFPIETVAIVAEVKSDINSIGELNNYLKKLSKVKELREDVLNPTPYYRKAKGDYNYFHNPFDNISTFLICNKLNFKLNLDAINYPCELRHRHNLILSLHDGYIAYTSNENVPHIPIPFAGNKKFTPTLAKNTSGEFPEHIGLFINALNAAIGFTTLLEIDLAFYLSDNTINKLKSTAEET